MNASIDFAFPATWDAADLAAAVPLRLSEFFVVDLGEDAAPPASANAPRLHAVPRPWRAGYVRPPRLPVRFRIL